MPWPRKAYYGPAFVLECTLLLSVALLLAKRRRPIAARVVADNIHTPEQRLLVLVVHAALAVATALATAWVAARGPTAPQTAAARPVAKSLIDK